MSLLFTMFHINDCIHCDRITDTFDDLRQEYPQHIFQDINVSDNPECAEGYALEIFPTVICNLDDEADRISGVISPDRLKKFVKEMDTEYGE